MSFRYSMYADPRWPAKLITPRNVMWWIWGIVLSGFAILGLIGWGFVSLIKLVSPTPIPLGTVSLITTAPDGTHLWTYESPEGKVYFSARGTQRREYTGKTSHTYTVTTED